MSSHTEKTTCPACGKNSLEITYYSRPFDYTEGGCLECGFEFYTKNNRLNLYRLNFRREGLGMKILEELPEINKEFEVTTVESLIEKFKKYWETFDDKTIVSYNDVDAAKDTSFEDRKRLVLRQEAKKFIGDLDAESIEMLAWQGSNNQAPGDMLDNIMEGFAVDALEDSIEL